MFSLPKDLNNALNDVESAVKLSLKENKLRYTIELKFEGLKLNNIVIRLYNLLSIHRKVFIVYSDTGSVALSQRDNPNIKDSFFTFKSFTESEKILSEDIALLSISPQPYDFDFFGPMTEEFKGIHYCINPKFEDSNVGIGSVIRERRNNFISTWQNLYFLQPLNKGALKHIFPSNWSLFKETDGLYYYVNNFESKPDNETIFVNL